MRVDPLQVRGYRGSRVVVGRHLAALRVGRTEPIRADIPNPHKITGWIMRPREALSDREENQPLQVRLACPDITRTCDLARTFADLVRHRRGRHLLMEWIRQAEQDSPQPMRGFAGFLRQDLETVTAGLTLTYSSGVVEGHINRLRRSSGRCAAADRSNSRAPAFCCDREMRDPATAKGPDEVSEDGSRVETDRWAAASPAMLGSAAELLVAAEFALAGYQVYEPLADDRGVDLLVDLGAGRHLLVQVKSARLGERDSYVFMRKKHFPLEPHRAVALVIFPAGGDRPECFLIPAATWREARPPFADRDYEERKSDPEYGITLHRRRWREDLTEWSLREQMKAICRLEN